MKESKGKGPFGQKAECLAMDPDGQKPDVTWVYIFRYLVVDGFQGKPKRQPSSYDILRGPQKRNTPNAYGWCDFQLPLTLRPFYPALLDAGRTSSFKQTSEAIQSFPSLPSKYRASYKNPLKDTQPE